MHVEWWHALVPYYNNPLDKMFSYSLINSFCRPSLFLQRFIATTTAMITCCCWSNVKNAFAQWLWFCYMQQHRGGQNQTLVAMERLSFETMAWNWTRSKFKDQDLSAAVRHGAHSQCANVPCIHKQIKFLEPVFWFVCLSKKAHYSICIFWVVKSAWFFEQSK